MLERIPQPYSTAAADAADRLMLLAADSDRPAWRKLSGIERGFLAEINRAAMTLAAYVPQAVQS